MFIVNERQKICHFYTGYALRNHVIEVVHEYSPLDCSFACLGTANCESYNARQESSDVYECELSSSTKTKHPHDFRAAAGVTYYGSDTFPGVRICKNSVNEKPKEIMKNKESLF